jgi:hypothetical protein
MPHRSRLRTIALAIAVVVVMASICSAATARASDANCPTTSKREYHFDCSVTTAATVIKTALTTAVSWHVGYHRGYLVIKNHARRIKSKASDIYRKSGKTLRKIRHRASHLGRRITGGGKNAGKAGQRFGRWLKDKGFSTGYLKDRAKRMALACGVGGTVMYLLHRYGLNDGHTHSLHAAADGCVGMAAGAAISK